MHSVSGYSASAKLEPASCGRLALTPTPSTVEENPMSGPASWRQPESSPLPSRQSRSRRPDHVPSESPSKRSHILCILLTLYLSTSVTLEYANSCVDRRASQCKRTTTQILRWLYTRRTLSAAITQCPPRHGSFLVSSVCGERSVAVR